VNESTVAYRNKLLLFCHCTSLQMHCTYLA